MWGQIAMAVAPTLIDGLLSYGGAKKADNITDGTRGRVQEDLREWKNSLNNYKNLSNKMTAWGFDMMDPMSIANQLQRQDIRRTGLDFVAQSNLLNQRNLSSGGMGGYSGIGAANLAALTQKSQAQSEDAFKQALIGNQKFGMSAIGQGASIMDRYVGGLKNYGELMAQGTIQNDALRARQQAMLGNSLGSGVSSALTDLLPDIIAGIGGGVSS